MSDTIQVVSWALGNKSEGISNYLEIPPHRILTNEDLWSSVNKIGLETKIRELFQITDPLWYGFWIDSPLTEEQCVILHDTFSEVVSTEPRCGKYLQDFIDVLNKSITNNEVLNVELSPPGHVDMGWSTTFAHCPRCKAESPFKRWQGSYPEEMFDCTMCRFSYSPATTYSMERDYFAASVKCESCDKIHSLKSFTEDEINLLEDQHIYREFCVELSWLPRVAVFFGRYPDLEGKIKPHALLVMESGDPEVQNQWLDGIPPNEIELPPESLPFDVKPRQWNSEELEVISYLQCHSVPHPARTKFVEESIQKLEKETQRVPCPECGGQFK